MIKENLLNTNSQSKVVLLKCNSYDPELIQEKLEYGLKQLGEITELIPKSDNILIKPNFLVPKKPEDSATTHPAIFEALLNILKENGYEKIKYGDSPGGSKAQTVAKSSGFKRIADKYGIELADFDHGQTVYYQDGLKSKAFDMANGAIEADSVISLSKMKTHALTRITGAIKNQFGYIYGLNKAGYHSKFPDVHEFSHFLIDLNSFKKPSLFIMDGIMAMEGNGPKNGDPVPMNVILMSNDPAAIDTVFAHLVNLDPMFVPTLQIAKERKFGATNLDEIELIGDNLEELKNPEFKVERIPAKGEAPKLGKLKYIKNLITRRPVIDTDKCIKCGICEKHCPQNPKAIQLKEDNYPKYNYNRCIRCFCCQELCPQNAIKVKTPLIGKLLFYR